uniref:Uncharacterized protein n=1 Tax=Oryza punctata TaxID=4537 RepID=A0A0E0L3Z5_ORYPU
MQPYKPRGDPPRPTGTAGWSKQGDRWSANGGRRDTARRARERAAALVSWPSALAINGGPGVPSSLRSSPVDDLSGLPLTQPQPGTPSMAAAAAAY